MSREDAADQLLDHFEHPYGFGLTDRCTRQATAENPLCGDRITIGFCRSSSDTLSELRFAGTGCLVSMAAASILCERFDGRPVTEFLAFSADEALKLYQLPSGSPRIGCALLGWRAMTKAIHAIHETGEE